MKVICASKPDKFKNLTLNKEYENVIEDGEAYVVPNDSGFRSRYAKKYFRVVPETPAEPPRPVTRNLLDILELSYEDGQLTITLNRTTRTVDLDISLSEISYGIVEVSGIQQIKEVVNHIFDNKVVAIVGDRNAFFRRVITYLLSELRNHNECAFFLMSDNDNIPHSDEFNSILSELAVGNFSRNNPNSNNNITLWIFNGTE